MGTGRVSIMLIEDNPADIDLFRMTMEEAKLEYPILVLRDGGEALEWARTYCPGESLIQLAVVDLNLPKHDGFEVLQAMRVNPALSGIPALVLSSSPSPRDVDRVKDFPNTIYMTKPSFVDEYLNIAETVRRLINSSPKSIGHGNGLG